MTITLDKTWSSIEYPVNFAVQTTDALIGKYCVWAMKQCLVAAGFTVSYSSDSTVEGTGAGDKWITSSNIVAAAAGTAHSWAVFTNTSWHPTAALCLDMTPSNSSYNQMTFVYADNGFNADGTYQNRPTAVLATVTWSTVYFRAQLSSLYNGTCVKCLYSSDSSSIRLFITADGQHADCLNSIGNIAILFEKPKYPVSWWSNPHVFGLMGKGSSGSAGAAGLSYANLTTAGHNSILTYIDGFPVYLRLGTVGVSSWVTHMAGFGMGWDGGMVMSPMYFLSDTASVPGVMGIMYDAYPAMMHHSDGMRFKTVGNNRGLVKAGALVLGCPYGPMFL